MTWFVELMHRDGSVQTRCRVDGSELLIGRALDNDLVIDDPYCAAHHARLSIAPDGSATLRDLGTRNGIVPARRQAGKTAGNVAAAFEVLDDAPFRIGQSSIRIRNSIVICLFSCKQNEVKFIQEIAHLLIFFTLQGQPIDGCDS